MKNNIKNWVDLEKSFNEEQRDALWQYFVDHSLLQKNGYLGIQFYVKDMSDFWRRLYARYSGDYKRYDNLERKHKQGLMAIAFEKRLASVNNEKIKKIEGGRNVYKKLVLFLYRRCRDILFYEEV